MGTDQVNPETPFEDPGISIEKARRSHRSYMVDGAPRYRVAGFFALSLVLCLYLVLTGDAKWQAKTLQFLVFVEGYALSAWLLHRWYYTRYRSSWLYLTFMTADIGAYLFAIYLSGGQNSWLIFVLIGRVADQLHLGYVRPLVFCHLIIVGYALMLAYLFLAQGHPIDWNIEMAKMLVLYGTGIYISTTAIPAQRIREAMKSALISGQNLLEALRQRSQEYLEEKENALEQSRVKTRFLANMSHEIRTPVNGILGMVQLLKNTKMSPEQAKYLKELHFSTGSLLGVIDHVLDYSQLTQGRYHLQPGPFSHREILENIVDQFSFHAYEQGLEVWLHVDEDLPETLIGDPLRLRQILINLLSNSIKFTSKGAVFIECAVLKNHGSQGSPLVFLDKVPDQVLSAIETLTAKPDEIIVATFVRDTGVGVPEDKLQTIFDHFSQVDDSNTRLYGGAGLGLAIVKEIVNLMGGVYGVKSKTGEGSLFWFALPFQKKNTHARIQPVKPKSLPECLVIPDQPHFEGMAVLLLSWGIKTTFSLQKRPLIELCQETPESGVLVEVGSADAWIAQLAEVKALPKTHQHQIGLLFPPTLPLEAKMEAHFLQPSQLLEKPLKRHHLFQWLNDFAKVATDPTADKTNGNDHLLRVFSGKKFLVAEDDKVSQLILKKILSDRGATVYCANDGQEAVELCQEIAFEAILMDIQMPVLDGLEASGKIRCLEKGGTLRAPIIAVSASILPDDLSELHKVGIDGYLAKPVLLESLVVELQRLNVI